MTTLTLLDIKIGCASGGAMLLCILVARGRLKLAAHHAKQ